MEVILDHIDLELGVHKSDTEITSNDTVRYSMEQRCWVTREHTRAAYRFTNLSSFGVEIHTIALFPCLDAGSQRSITHAEIQQQIWALS